MCIVTVGIYACIAVQYNIMEKLQTRERDYVH